MSMPRRDVLPISFLCLWVLGCGSGSSTAEPFQNVPPCSPAPVVPGPVTVAPAPVPEVPEVPVVPEVSCDFVTAGSFSGQPVAPALQAMATGKILNIIPSRKSGRTVKVTLLVEPDWRVFFKPRHRVHLFTRPQGEVGAFRMNRLLGMNHVPPAVVRTFNRSVFHSAFRRHAPPDRLAQLEREVLSPSSDDLTGAMLLWVGDAVNYEPPASLMERMSRPGESLSPREESLIWDLSWMLVLDHLTNNYDRFTGGNILRRKDGRLVFIDNGAAFGPDQDWKAQRRRVLLRRLSRHAPGFTRALLRVEPRVMAACAGDVLSQRDIDEILSRRDELMSHFRELEKNCPIDCRFARELETP
jgi:hypothetical protein